MRKATAVCYIDSSDKSINAYALHTMDRHLIDLSTAMKRNYTSTYDLVTHCVILANHNGFEIPFVKYFGGKCYDILFIDRATSVISRYCIKVDCVKVD